MRPYEIITSPFSAWVAPSGTAFPLLGAAPGAGWVLLGTNDTRSQDEDGVTLTHEQTVNEIRAAGSTGPLKAARTEEGLVIGFNLMDLTLEAYSYALNGNDVTEVAPGVGTAGTVEIGLSRGFLVREFALMLRGPSAYDEDLLAQYEVPRAYESASPAPQFTKGAAALLALEFRALEDLDAASDEERFGRLIMQNAPPTGP